MRYEFNNTFSGNEAIPSSYLLGYSVPTKYGGAPIPLGYFTRPVYLLGGRPDVQRRLASEIPVVSLTERLAEVRSSKIFELSGYNPKVVGSNPAPATKLIKGLRQML